MQDITVRRARPEDGEECGRFFCETFKGIAERHHFRPDFPSADARAHFAHHFIYDPAAFGGGSFGAQNF